MARKRISEYKAKSLLFEKLSLPYTGKQVASSDLSSLGTLDASKTYVVKVDQGVKKRFKLGLVILDVPASGVTDAVKTLSEKGYSQFLIEPFEKHEDTDERYVAFQRDREGMKVFVSRSGGVNIEENEGTIQQFLLPHDSIISVSESLGVERTLIEKIVHVMDDLHISFLEVNPLVIKEEKIFFLDLAIEVDSAGAFFVKNAWSEQDFVGEGGGKTDEEKAVDVLSEKSQASFRLVVLNPDGSLFMLLSGGGASIVLADEVYNQGKGKELANYGEYSGNPNAEETYLYTKQLLSLLLKSSAPKKVLIIAGGVANFTDIRITFRGIIQALDEVKNRLKDECVKVYVRRGGPYQEEGLMMMSEYLKKEELYGEVCGPEIVLTDIVEKALKEIA